MLLNKNNLAIHTIASKKETNPEIMGVYITPEETVATDTFMLVAVTTPKDDAREFPIRKDGSKTQAKDVRTIIPASLAKAVMSNIPADAKIALPILENAIVSNFKGEKQITLSSTDLETWHDTTGEVVEGTYRAYKKLISQEAPETVTMLNYEYLKKGIEALARTSNRLKEVKIEMYGKDKPIKLTSKNGEQETTVVIMPIRSDESI